jgi:hypothetical protein
MSLPGLSRLAACCLLLCLCAACAAPKDMPGLGIRPERLSDEQRAERLWRGFANRFAGQGGMGGPFRIAAGLRYSDPQNKNTRADALLWGNGDPAYPWPLRLDLRVGVGTVAAKARETQDSLIVYSPDENMAYVQAGGKRGLAAFGMPIPLDLADLALLLAGRAGNLFLPVGMDPLDMPPWSAVGKDRADFRVDSVRLPGIVTISSSGLPLAWRESRQGGWSIAFTYDADKPERPQKLRITHPDGYSALIAINDIVHLSSPFSEAQLTLALPPGVEKTLVKQ